MTHCNLLSRDIDNFYIFFSIDLCNKFYDLVPTKNLLINEISALPLFVVLTHSHIISKSHWFSNLSNPNLFERGMILERLNAVVIGWSSIDVDSLSKTHICRTN